MFKVFANRFKKLIIAFVLLWAMPVLTFAQSLTLSGQPETTTSIIPSGYYGYVLVGFRLLLGILLLFAGMVAFRAGFNWMYWEGNAKKAHEGKTTLAKALFFITILFFIAVIFRWWLGGDYTSLLI